jgi:glycosyltransferase involved in cell wall biosynthesis
MISLCLTNYERYDLLLQSFEQVLHDPRIGEIVISDDHSSGEIYASIEGACQGYAKVKLFRNDQNVGMSRNKQLAIERATNEWCILFDSDNVLKENYLSGLYQSHWHPNVINVPESGGDRLNYTRFSKWYVSKHNIEYFLSHPGADMLLNTCNYFVNRERYLEVYEYNPAIKASDTIWFNYLWLKKGGAFIVVPNMRYYHRVHQGSGFMEDVKYNTKKCNEIKDLIKALPHES